jgi:hypothetical protein
MRLLQSKHKSLSADVSQHEANWETAIDESVLHLTRIEREEANKQSQERWLGTSGREEEVNIPAACPVFPFVASVAVTHAALAALLAPQRSPKRSHMKLVMMSMSIPFLVSYIIQRV